MLRQPAPAAISEPAPILIGPVVPVAIIKVERRSARLPAIRFGSSAAPAARASFAPLLTLWLPPGLEDGPIFFSHPPTSYFFNDLFSTAFLMTKGGDLLSFGSDAPAGPAQLSGIQ